MECINEVLLNAVKKNVEAQLKAPASAKYLPAEDLLIEGDDLNGYHISGYVDSQNPNGAMMRTDFTARILKQGETYIASDVKVGVKAAQARSTEFMSNYIIITLIVIVASWLMTKFLYLSL